MSSSSEDVEMTECHEYAGNNLLSDVRQSREGIPESQQQHDRDNLSQRERRMSKSSKTKKDPLSVAKTRMKRHRPYSQRIDPQNSLLDLNSLLEELKALAIPRELFPSPSVHLFNRSHNALESNLRINGDPTKTDMNANIICEEENVTP